MFKEKYLAFKEVPPFGGEDQAGIPESQEIILGGSTETKDHGQDIAEMLSTTSDQIMIDIFGPAFIEAKIALGPKFTELMGYFKDRIDLGWEYVDITISPSEIFVVWENEEGQSKISLRDYLGDLTREELVGLIDERLLNSMEKLRKEMAKDFINENVYKQLKKSVGEYKAVNNRGLFWSSKLIKRDLMPLLMDEYAQGKEVEFEATETGFIINGTEQSIFWLYKYDERLNDRRQTLNERTINFIDGYLLEFFENARPDLSYEDLNNSDLVKEELLPILQAGFISLKPCKVSKGGNGFYLTSDNADIGTQQFDLNRYDENLNFKESGQTAVSLSPGWRKVIADIKENAMKGIKDEKNLSEQLDLDKYMAEPMTDAEREEQREMEAEAEERYRRADEIEAIKNEQYGEVIDAARELRDKYYDEDQIGIDDEGKAKFYEQMDSVVSGNEDLESFNATAREYFDRIQADIESGEIANPEEFNEIKDNYEVFRKVEVEFERLIEQYENDPESLAALRAYEETASALGEVMLPDTPEEDN